VRSPLFSGTFLQAEYFNEYLYECECEREYECEYVNKE